MRWVLVLSFLMSLFSAILNAAAVCMPYWLYTERPFLKYQGLWQRCEPPSGSGSLVECELIVRGPEFLDATRVMMLFGFAFYVFATICSFMYTFIKKEKASLVTAATVLVCIGAILSMIGVIAYGAMYPRLLRAQDMGLHAGFGVAVCCTITGFMNVLFYCMARAKGDVD